MDVRYLGHACFLLSDGQYRLLVDPYLSGNALCPVSPDEVEADYLLITHGHGDHIGDGVAIAARTGATVFATVETAGLFPAGTPTDVGQIGGRIAAPFGSVKFTSAAHGSGVPGGLSCGFIIEMGGQKIYHAGDTGLIMDMLLLKDEAVDLALLPIGDRYTMGPEDALRAVKMIAPKQVVPMHYDTFPVIRQDPEAFKKAVEAETGAKVTVLAIGDSLTL